MPIVSSDYQERDVRICRLRAASCLSKKEKRKRKRAVSVDWLRKTFRSDSPVEYKETEFFEFLHQNGTIRHRSCPGSKFMLQPEMSYYKNWNRLPSWKLGLIAFCCCCIHFFSWFLDVSMSKIYLTLLLFTFPPTPIYRNCMEKCIHAKLDFWTT